ncbi:MAG: hypothetical protein HOK30_15330 [Rhodospirillaceae bacterium]|jgi:hypothetical protein|nr:hypothetical protein [Rhodospirillaceae bacterium]MBT6429039.1 hypothetical protein [Rhodospirillaceae bacterium]
MGIQLHTVYIVCYFVQQRILPKSAHIVDLGAQEFHTHIDPDAMAAIFSEFRPDLMPSRNALEDLSGDKTPGRIYEALGFGYNCVDVFPADRGFVCDLNFDTVPDELAGKADLVTNFGTTEHVMNQLNCFRFIHELTRPGSVMWHIVPTSDFNTHGFFKYDPKLYWYLAKANDYKDFWMRFCRSDSNNPVPEVMLKNGLPDQEAIDTAMDVVLRRTTDAPFQLPLDLDINTDEMQMTDDLTDRYGDEAVVA